MQREPIVKKLAWRLSRDVTFAELALEARSRGELDAGTWARILEHRGLHADRERLDAAVPPERIQCGAEIRVYWFVDEPTPVPITATELLFRERGVVGVNKPPGIPVQGTRASVRLSLEAQLKDLLGIEWLTPAHRLDRDTSGLILFATSPEVAHTLHQQFEHRQVQKTYLAWTEPPPAEKHFEVQGYIYQVPHPRHARYALATAPRPEARSSQTRFDRLGVQAARALVRAHPVTGRTHQIRIHLASVGAPIVGDRLYGTAEADLTAPRLMLHAESLRIRLPGSAAPDFFVAPVPVDFGLEASVDRDAPTNLGYDELLPARLRQTTR
jgi:23S rRNA pseudouridine1911/1915/1917 synthase